MAGGSARRKLLRHLQRLFSVLPERRFFLLVDAILIGPRVEVGNDNRVRLWTDASTPSSITFHLLELLAP